MGPLVTIIPPSIIAMYAVIADHTGHICQLASVIILAETPLLTVLFPLLVKTTVWSTLLADFLGFTHIGGRPHCAIILKF